MSLSEGQVAVGVVLASFVGTVALTRTITRVIRARQNSGGVFKNIHINGVHVHHQVWGILLVLLTGLLSIAYQPHQMALYILAGFFGVGAALALDEFAMWVHMRDVYWQKEGRASISALAVAAAICTALLIGINPLEASPTDFQFGDKVSPPAIAVTVIINFLLSIICIVKGKLSTGIVGIFVPFMAFIGAVRLAKPGSWWARKYYHPGSRRARRTARRFGDAYYARHNWLIDYIGGKHS